MALRLILYKVLKFEETHYISIDYEDHGKCKKDFQV